MAASSKPLAAQQRLPMPSSENKDLEQSKAEQAADPRQSKRPQKLVQQPLSLQQPEERKRRLNILESGATGASHKRARHNPDKAAPKGYSEQSDKNMSHLLARQKSSGSLRRRKSPLVSVDPASVVTSSVAPSSTTPSDQKPRDVKSAPYQDPRYETLLATKGSFMIKSDLDVDEGSKTLCRSLLEKEQTVHEQSLFRDDLFEQTFQKIQNRNEARALTTYGAKHLKVLIESVNEGWNNSFPLTGTPFTNEQLDKLALFIGNFISGDQSYFMATYYIYFLILTCEVKCGAAALDIADRQNAHSMTLAVRATIKLFRLVGREMKLYWEILAFSVSHDHRSVRIYGHYAVIDGKDTKYYRHPIHEFSFIALDGKEKWTAYKFTKNVYDIWMLNHFKRLCSAIDQIPADLDFSVPQLSQIFGLSEDLQRHNLSGSSQPDSQSQGNSQQSTGGGARDSTPNTSSTGQGAPKRPRKRLAEGQ
ncbi:hypothetical protein F4805DRAFT_471344 [Annulohypoxylon moriforme]|nr:hypothetical protein F4805DRAFT_471344 [Annulohypoxylon moriforme]